MGGNGSYNKALGRVRGYRRTHKEYHARIAGHKILIQNRNPMQVKIPVNSDSDSPIYLGARKTRFGAIEITTIGIYKNHKCIGQIDLKFDKDGNFIPYSSSDKGSSHYHKFQTDEKTGTVSRKSHNKNNTFAIDSNYNELIQKIVDFNQKQRQK